eukprot:1236126-Lingulodinium_polyedra.AAC.1
MMSLASSDCASFGLSKAWWLSSTSTAKSRWPRASPTNANARANCRGTGCLNSWGSARCHERSTRHSG